MGSADCWPLRRTVPDLRTGEVHVWKLPLDQADRTAAFGELLIASELKRAGSFLRQKAGEHFIIVRGALRVLLGAYLSRTPRSVAIDQGPNGKPYLADDAQLKFNLSHSEGLALLAVARDMEVGVDVQWRRSSLPIDQAAETFFAPAERTVLAALIGRARMEAFFDGWTQKEAFLKATGYGLTFPASQVEVSIQPGAPAGVLRVSGEEPGARGIHLIRLRPGNGYAGCVAADGPIRAVRCFLWGLAGPIR